MKFLTITLISAGLAMDAFTISLGIGIPKQIPTRRGKIRPASHFRIFQAGMPALGWLSGETIAQKTRSDPTSKQMNWLG